MAEQLFTNNANGTLSGTLAQAGTTMTLAAGQGTKFPAPTGTDYFLGTLYEKDGGGNETKLEVVKVTARTADTLTIVRDFESMTGQVGGYAYDGNATTVYFALRWTAAGATGMEQTARKDASGGYVGKTLEKINAWNAARTYMSFIVNAATAARTWTFPDKDGTVAMTGDLSVSGMVKGDGTVLSAATAGVDYSAGTSALATGILKSTTTTGALSIAGAGDFPTLNQNTTGTAAGLSAVLSGTFGGTGVDNGASTLTYAGNVAFTGAYAVSFTIPGAFTYTYPAATSTLAALGLAQTFTGAQRGEISVLADGATITADLSLANQYSLTLGGNRTLGFPTNPVAGQQGIIKIRQDSTGSRTLAYAWCFDWAGGTAGTLSTPGCSLDQLVYSVDVYAQSTVTITIATPGVVSWTAHGLENGQKIQLTTTGALPTGLTASTTYYVAGKTADDFKLATTLANAAAGTYIATSGSQSGTHTMTACSISLALNKAWA